MDCLARTSEPAFPTSIFFLPFRSIYIYIYSLPGSGLFRRNYIPLPSSLGQENGKSVEIGSRHLRGETWMLRIFHPALNWKIFFHELDDFFSPIQGIRFYIISLNKISLVREMNSSRSIDRERAKYSVGRCVFVLNEQTNEKSGEKEGKEGRGTGRSEKQWEEREVGGQKRGTVEEAADKKKKRDDIVGWRDIPLSLPP